MREPGQSERGLAPAGSTYADWEGVYEDNVTRIHCLMYRKVGNRADAEDLTSQVFMTALRSLRTTATVGEARAHLLATARTVLARHWQQTLGRQVTVLALDLSDLADEDEPGAHEERCNRAQERADHILEPLQAHDRRVLELRFLLSRSLRETAAVMGLTVARVKVLQHRALRRASAADPEG